MAPLPVETSLNTLALHSSRHAEQEHDQEQGLEVKSSPEELRPHFAPGDSTKQDAGVTRIEGLYLVFGRGWGLYSLWASIGLIAYVYSLSRLTTAYYAAFATSAFGEHTIIGTIGVVNSIIAGVAPPIIAKLADLWSRPHALTLAVTLYAVGYAMCAGAQNVSTVVAGQVVYTLGNTGITFLNSLLIADITSLQWRAFVDGAVNLPYVVNAFVSGYIVEDINGYSANGWRWGYGMFCILLPVCVSPALIVLLIGDHRAKKLGTTALGASATRPEWLARSDELQGKSTLQIVLYYCNRLNILGFFLMSFAFALILTPMTLNTTAEGGYKNPSLIAMLVIGGILFICWAVWDGFYAEYPFMPRRVFNRTFVACLLADFFYYFSSYLVDGYFASWVYVIVDWSDKHYQFFNNTVTVGTCGFAFMFGLLMRYTHRYKAFQLFGLCLRSIGAGLVYLSATKPTDAVLVCSQVLIGIGASVSIIASYLGVQSSVPHQDLAIATAVLNLWASVGSSISLAISASVWNREVPNHLEKYLGSMYNATERATIFGSIYVARLTEPRNLVKQAYLESMKPLFLAALITSFCSIIAAAFAKNYYLGDTHNAIEDKVIKFRDQQEIEEELTERRP
ncbi:hypothetical protein V865_006343 [Kwoniella europaea PYCC6329]|uniref:Siderophore-iron transporter Str3 n=1 Tax=Kwoniella europaea PYCC6329 TaxID=1423913 RepID=A0AAX4KPG3_9TREE